MENLEMQIKDNHLLEKIKKGEEVLWINPGKIPFQEASENLPLTEEDIEEARKRLERFAPLLMKYFPETRERNGLIESPLTEIPYMKKRMEEKYGKKCRGRLFLKEDNRLAIAGSVKARGGIYEVLKHTEDLALAHGLLKPGEGYEHLGDPEKKRFFKDYTIQVGSTGNLGLSIGIISAVLGYKVIIHMSADAKQWKKDLLRSYGVDVREYRSDYGKAVEQGRKLSARDEKSYFVDDENSKDLFLGYATAEKRIADQLQEAGIAVDQEHPLFVYIPCGVGGAPGGITFGLKEIYGDHVHCFFAEPVQAPCMLLGMSTGLHDRISVEDVGLTGKTQADGLAVGRPSAFVGKVMEPLLSGAVTVEDEKLYRYMKEAENLQIIQESLPRSGSCLFLQKFLSGGHYNSHAQDHQKHSDYKLEAFYHKYSRSCCKGIDQSDKSLHQSSKGYHQHDHERRYQSPQFPACDFQEYAEGDQYQSAEELVGASEERPDIGVAYLCQDIAECQCDQSGKIFVAQDFSPAFGMFHVIHTEQLLERHTSDTCHGIQGSESQGGYAHGHKALGHKYRNVEHFQETCDS